MGSLIIFCDFLGYTRKITYSILVKFESSLDQANFFSNLSKLPKTQKVQVSQEFPASLRFRLKRLKQLAWEKRQSGLKTVIKRDDSFGLTLFVKKGSAPWSNYFSKKSSYFSIMLRYSPKKDIL